MNKAWAAAIGVMVCLVIAACRGGQPRSGGVITTVDTVGRIEYVRNAGTPLQWSGPERLTLGSAGNTGAPRDDEFSRITGVLGDGDGNVYVADANAREIRVFDGSGALVRRFGRQGSGPGEFQNLQSIAWLGDTLAVLDAGNARLGLFRRDGAWLGHRGFAPLSGSSIRLYPTRAGELYMPFIGRARGLVYVQQTVAGAGDTLSADLRKPGEEAGPSEMYQRARTLSVQCTHSAGQGISVYSADLGPRNVLVPAPGSLRAAAWTSDYQIAFVNAAGDTTRIVQRDVPTGPLSDDEWGAEERKFQEFLDQFPDESCEPRSLPRPEFRRIILGIVFDEAGRMWVEHETAAGRAFDAFDDSGRLLGTVASSPRFDRVPAFIRGDRIYFVTTDSLDVQYVSVREVVREH